MKNILVSLFLLGVQFIHANSPIKHKILAVDNHSNTVFLLDQYNNTNNWTVKVPKGSRDLQIINKTDFLMSHSKGYQIRKLKDGSLIQSYDLKKGVQSAQLIANNIIVLAANTSKGIKLIYLNRKNNEVVKNIFIENKKNVRLVRNIEDKIIITTTPPHQALILNENGIIEKEINLKGKGYLVNKLLNENLVLTTGGNCELLEINENGDIINSYGGRDNFPNKFFNWFSGFVKSKEGYIVANWLGHGKVGTAASHLIEFNNKNEIVWEWEDNKTAKVVTNFLLLDNYEAINTVLSTKTAKNKMNPITDTKGRFGMDLAYHIHDQFLQKKRNSSPKNDFVAGYKIAYASKASQDKWGIKEPVYGAFLNSQLIKQNDTINTDEFNQFHIETEIAVKLKKDITKKITTFKELTKYIDEVYLSYDIPDNVFTTKPFPEDISASGSGAKYFVLGEGKKVKAKTLGNTNLIMKQYYNNKLVYKGAVTNVMGHPYNSVIWLSKKMLERGKYLKKGQIIVTGSVAAAFVPNKDEKKGTHKATCKGFSNLVIYTK